MGKHVHKLSNLNLDLKTATCANCGEVSIRKKGEVWYCWFGAKQHRVMRGQFRGDPETRKTPYGITRGEGRALKQGKSCEICSRQIDLKIDHCHTSGEIRGVLCNRCNVGIGFFLDDVSLSNSAIKYLTK